MKERPIIFSGDMIKAIRAGTKTQTRRVIKPQPYISHFGDKFVLMTDGTWAIENPFDGYSGEYKCPHGTVGDPLWVRETIWYGPQTLRVEYDADFDDRAREAASFYGAKKKPSIYMPRWCSRILLEITGVRVEQVQDISEEDAKAEGVPASDSVEMKDGSPCYTLPFQELWEQIHGIDNSKAWDQNPWVWVITFKRITRGD